ncbi:hypothetical protein ABPG74_000621 [Tetrahymena malaccensis]
MGGAVSNCSCQAESRTQDLGSSNMNPKVTAYNPNEEAQQRHEEKVYKVEPQIIINQAVPPPPPPSGPKIYEYINSYTHRKFQQVQSELKENQLFFDSEFPPALDSLTKNSTLFPEAINLEWRRLNQIFTKEKILIDPSQQIKINSSSSLLGSNYAFSFALGVLGFHSDLIKLLFEMEEYNEKGVYSVWLNFNGEWKEIIIDDQLPCLNSKSTPAFIKPQGFSCGGSSTSPATKFEIWAPLIEKAYAKIYQSYDKLDVGTPEQIITDLTGSPYKSAQTVDASIAWKFITSNLGKKHILTGTPKQPTSQTLTVNTTSTVSASPQKDQNDQNKPSMAKYVEIIDAKEVEVNNFIRERIVKIRNPLGPCEWKGDWSANSQKWTPQLREQVEAIEEGILNQNLSQPDQNVTWMPLESFCSMYQYVYCNFINQNYYFYCRNIIPSALFSSQQNNNELRNSGIFNQNKLYIIPIEVKEDNTHLFIQYHIADKRTFYKQKGSLSDNQQKNIVKQYPPVNFFLFKGDEEKVMEYMREEYFYDRNGCIENTFNKGTYLAVLNVKWGSKEESKNGLSISSYSNKRVEIKEHLTDQTKIDNAIDQCLMNIPPLMSKDIHKYPEDVDHIERFHNVALGYSYYVYTNRSQTTTLKETGVMSDRKFLTICYPYTNSDSYTIEVKPLQKQIVKYAIDPEGLGLYQGNLVHHTIFSYSNEDLYPMIKADLANKQFQIVNGEKTEVEFYQHLFEGGLAIFFLNNSNKTYCEEFKVELKNLDPTSEGHSSNQLISIQVPSKRTRLFVFPQIDPVTKPSFKFTSISKSFKTD